ncbi:two-component sensor histidine kinase, partial [Streptomyces violaceusniger]
MRGCTACAASTAAVILAGIGWWVHRDVYRQNTQIAQEQALEQLWALVDQLKEGAVPVHRSAVPYEVVATGRRTAVAYGGGMDDFDPGTHHVMPTPTGQGAPNFVRLPVNRDYNPGIRGDMAGGTHRVMSADIRADELSSDKVAALGVAADAKLRVYVVALPYTAEENTKITDRLLLLAGLVSLVLIAAVTYFAVRIALRPVEAIRVLTASVTA